MKGASLVALLLVALAVGCEGRKSPRLVVDALFAAFDRHDIDAMTRLYATDARLSSADFCTPRGHSDVARTDRALFDAYADPHDEIETIVVADERVAVRLVSRSTSAGFALPIATFMRVRDGLIVEDDRLFDTGGRPCAP